MPGYNRAELSVELTVVPASDGALSPREQTEAARRTASESGPARESGPVSHWSAARRGACAIILNVSDGPARTTPKLSASDLDALDRDAFMRHFGALYEHSPWVAEGAWERRPFADVDDLRRAFERTVLDAPPERRLALIRAHPELAGREAREGALTTESAEEQASAGLNALRGAEMATLERLNAAYRERFGFPMVVAVREHTKASIFAQARERLDNPRAEEIDTALREILKIGRLRLGGLVSEMRRTT
jgi:2-oxo-4-hydroxy-4-carboxy-5-ureidoimidazoline decarboxylase